MKVWVGVVVHEFGMNQYAAKTKAKLEDQIYEYVEEWWPHEFPDESFPAHWKNKRRVIDCYFQWCENETCEIEQLSYE